MIRAAVSCAALLALAGCADLAQVCEDVEPFRPIIRGVVTAAEPLAALPFMVTRQVHCSDLERAAERFRD